VRENAWRFARNVARRDLHRSLRGLRLLFLCVFLGVATLATIGSLSASITSEIAERGAVLLGGDVQASMTQRRATAEERQALSEAGRLSETIRMRAMARRSGSASAAVLIELKGVDNAYPLYGQLEVDGSAASAPSANAIFIAPELAHRLGAGRGDRLQIGEADFQIAGVITEEPDRVGEGFTLGPVAIVSMRGLARSGLVQPGSLYTTKYRLRMPPGSSPRALIDSLESRFPDAGWDLRDRDRAAPGASRFFDRMGQFLTLIGLAALVIAGIGVGNGVASHLRQKRDGIATMKMLGGTSGDVGRVYFLQIGMVGLLATGAGLVAGVLLPAAVIAAAGDLLPVQPGLRLHPAALAASAAYAMLMTLLFVLPPLARARRQPVASLFRKELADQGPLDRGMILLVAAAGVAIVVLVLGTSDEPLFAAGVIGSIAAVFMLLALIGWGVRAAARAFPAPRRPLVRLALSGLHRPGSQTVALVVALGLAFTLFVTLAAVQTSLAAEIARTVPDRAPNQFVLDIPSERRAEFTSVVQAQAPGAEINIVPALRGTITAFGGKRVSDLDQLPPEAWFLRGERGLTYSPTVPEGSAVVAGSWWPSDYRGPPLVSLDREVARVLDIGVGDSITVNLLGREIEARIASLREIQWDTMGFNYILVFPPSALEAAPHSLAATIKMNPDLESAVSRALLAVFPSVSIIDVGDIIAQVAIILDQMAAAILVAAGVAILAGVAVLIGALAASRQARSYDSVILKMLGATRGQILAAQTLEYALLAVVVAAVSLALGLAGGWYVIVQIFNFGWRPDWPTILATLIGGIGLTLGIAMIGSLPLLAVRPARALRHL
jgi:putative ABC transport system permease protein